MNRAKFGLIYDIRSEDKSQEARIISMKREQFLLAIDQAKKVNNCEVVLLTVHTSHTRIMDDNEMGRG